ncbi:hypothetical protein [Aeromonas sanarellii]|uniref:hypothetical protein n=1 Tax=Aeromonas sanarellii TaxID=633415 RepID=UPI003B9F22CC
MMSNGQELFFEHGIKQAVGFHASFIDIETRLAWSESFPKKKYRKVESKVSDSTFFLVISQNCDIATHRDDLDSAIELAVCKSIKERSVTDRNQFAISSRRLQFLIEGKWYEASTEYIITVEKLELLSAIKSKSDFKVTCLSKECQITVPIWRANRYYRAGLPNKFNESLGPILAKHMPEIESAACVEHDDFKSFIRAMYVKLDSLDESDSYRFEFFALLRDSVDDKTMTDIQGRIESMGEELAEQSGFADCSGIYADRERNTYVSYLNDFLRLNLDHHSLSLGDDDIGPVV